ncbi:hypothetical protein QBC46DRAFT_40869 [Diplogelasinospora grovesii]|uniref:F-box domain-containing protein n=1 Tax=Diplogelasinospora grovesii TaxID=303347 RepID=A0AAN6MZA2_9PEZI|nr:hypothetical protein QBC46DRAFT_40869 [Diplogelasinospora grovesii]
MTEVLYSTATSLQDAGSGQEPGTKELGLVRGQPRVPRRSYTYLEYQLPQLPVMTLRTIRQQPLITENTTDSQRETKGAQTPRRRPPLGPPRRSYSATDKEPIPHHHRLSPNKTLLELAAELHYAIFDFLDPIDSTCLGLTNKHFYAIHRRMHGSVPLSVRRDGPNELEWAWHIAGNVVRSSSALSPNGNDSVASTTVTTPGDKEKNALSQLRVRGQAYCRKCGVTRCELHKHIQEWMPEGYEYCCITEKFGPAPSQGASPYCYMSKPGDARRCGRHRVRKSKVALQ